VQVPLQRNHAARQIFQLDMHPTGDQSLDLMKFAPIQPG